MVFAEGLPVRFILEDLLNLCYLFLLAAIQCFFQLVSFDVVNNRLRLCLVLSETYYT